MTTEQKWDSMTPSERVALLKRDPSMRHPSYVNLVERMSNSKFSELSELQKDSIPEFLRR